MRILLALFLLSACAAEPAPEAGNPVAGAALSCIDPSRIVARRAEPPASIVFDLAGGARYRNDLQGSCPGVERANGSELVEIELDGTRLCANDSVRVYDPVEAKGVGSRAFARCRLGAFTPIAAR
ncbi:MAG TPA: hypothetical protein VF718_14170 [Allosphingosinicella sp.]|jgi:hypothetical protein